MPVLRELLIDITARRDEDASMRVSFGRTKAVYRLDEPVRTSAVLTNDGEAPSQVNSSWVECRYRIDGEEVFWEQSSASRVTLAPGESITLPIVFELDAHTLFRDVKELRPLTLEVHAKVVVDLATWPCESPRYELEIDFRETERLRAPDGRASVYVRDGARIVYLARTTRAYELRCRSVRAESETARALDERYLVDATQVFRDGRLQRGVSARGFRVWSRVFAGNATTILTSYGDAKVADPASFEALDDGTNAVRANSYAAGYGRDARQVYWFDESSSTKHASVVKGADATTFESLDGGYGRDRERVYQEGRRVQGADAASWKRVGHAFSRDARAVYFGTARVPGADPASFEAISDDPSSRDACWGRDATAYFERTERRSAADLDAHRAAVSRRVR